MKTYIIDNWHLLKVELSEKEIKNWKKNFFHYQVDDIVIFNKDYNKIKPYLMYLLQKKGFIKYVYNTVLVIWFWLISFILYFVYYNLNKNINLNIKKTETVINKLEDLTKKQANLTWKVLNVKVETKKWK